jgi:Kef-type K+ transport system membrane component KefB
MTFLHFSRFFLYAATFAVTIVLSTTFFPFIGGKYYFFRFCVELALIFLIFYWGFEDEAGEIKEKLRRLFRQPLFLAVSVFAFMFLLSSLAAYDPDAAFWSNYERGEGGF